MEIHEIEERKNAHINDLMDNHEKAFNEMRDYYNSITRDNLALIKSLKVFFFTFLFCDVTAGCLLLGLFFCGRLFYFRGQEHKNC